SPTLSELELTLGLPGGPLAAKLALDAPLAALPAGSFAAALLEHPVEDAEMTVAVVDPARPNVLHYYYNEARGFVTRPETPSPDELDVDLGRRRTLVAFGAVVVEELDAAAPPVGFAPVDVLVSRVGDRVAEVVPLGRHHVDGVLRRGPDTADLVLTFVGTYNTFGNGTCGMCPVALLNVQTVHRDGHFDEPWWHAELGGGPPVTFEPVSASASRDGTRIVVRGNAIATIERAGRTTERVTGGVETTFTWDAARGEFVRKDRPVKPIKRP
ncbi:MAG TPA: hypothetical protein VHB21_01550, partial [Minicystis sp.]|nr:hypothetical protein [Minicystis sp.]